MPFKHPVQIHLTVNCEEVSTLAEIDTLEVIDHSLHFQGLKEKFVQTCKEAIGNFQRWDRDCKVINLSYEVDLVADLKPRIKAGFMSGRFHVESVLEKFMDVNRPQKGCFWVPLHILQDKYNITRWYQWMPYRQCSHQW